MHKVRCHVELGCQNLRRCMRVTTYVEGNGVVILSVLKQVRPQSLILDAFGQHCLDICPTVHLLPRRNCANQIRALLPFALKKGTMSGENVVPHRFWRSQKHLGLVVVQQFVERLGLDLRLGMRVSRQCWYLHIKKNKNNTQQK